MDTSFATGHYHSFNYPGDFKAAAINNTETVKCEIAVRENTGAPLFYFISCVR